VTRTKLSEKT